ncbi:MAG: hypothetical protein WBA34_04845 [Candidatus Deferrimicrobiaceae bacterium]
MIKIRIATIPPRIHKMIGMILSQIGGYSRPPPDRLPWLLTTTIISLSEDGNPGHSRCLESDLLALRGTPLYAINMMVETLE